MPENESPAAPAPNAPRHVYLVDGSGYIFRAFHALPPMTRADGTPVNAVYGFTNMLLQLIDQAHADEAADYFAVIFDSDRRSFRNDIYSDYKAQRPEPPAELVPQFGLIRDATRALNLPCIELHGYEADDLIATYARAAAARGTYVTIVSSDKDLMQLVGGTITMWDPIKSRRIGEAEVREKFGVGPDKVVDVQALAGDATDNVPGVPGIGVKTAAELINSYGDLENLLAHVAEIKQPKRRENLTANAELARISRELVRLKDDVPIKETLDSFLLQEPDHGKLLEFLRANQFRSLINRIEARQNSATETARGTGSAATAATLKAREVKAVDGKDYVLVQDEAALAEWIAAALGGGQVALAIVASASDPMRAETIGFALSVEPGRACYVPVAHRAPVAQAALDLGGDGEGIAMAPKQIPLERAVEMLKPVLEDPGILKIGHDIKYATVLMRRLGVRIAAIDDVTQLSYVLDGSSHGHGLDELAELHLGHKTTPRTALTGTGKAQIGFDLVPLDKARDCAAEDADMTLRLHRFLKPRLVEARMVTVYESIERPLIPVVAEMERAGIKVDAAELTRLSEDFAARLAELEAEIHRLAGREFNVGSPKQLGEILFDEMGLSAGTQRKSSKTGAYTTGAEVLEGLAAQGHDLPARVLDWRQLAKLKSTYTDALLQTINPETGRVHTCYALAATSTGRLSSTDPNLQNIPVRTEEGRKIRRAFVAEKGHKLLSVDYSQIELRLAAHMAEIAPLRDAFRAGIDIHALTASQVFGVPVEGMDPMVRRRAKAINFGIIYGISPFGLAQQLGIPQAEAKAYIEAYFARYPGIRAYMDKTKKRAREHGYVTTLFGRRCYMPGINDKNPAKKAFMERAAINAPLQGTAADIIKRAMIRVPPALAAAKLSARMLLQVHDELLFEVPDGEAQQTAELVKRVMEDAIHPAVTLDVPLVADTGIADSWAEAH